jgi:hypothetical protein
MANITTSGTTGYPAVIDTRSTLTDGAGGDEIVANHPNGLGAAVVAIETELGTLPKGSATDLKTRLSQALNNDGTIKSSVIVANTPISVSYAGGIFTLTTTGPQSGQIVQMVSTQVTGFTTTAGTIPHDNTPIQSSEGSSFGLSVSMKPISTLNSVYVRLDAHGASSGNTVLIGGLFLASSSSAIFGFRAEGGGSNFMSAMSFQWKATTVSTATTTYSVNLASSAGTFTLNGQASAGLFGNAVSSLLTVWEVQN